MEYRKLIIALLAVSLILMPAVYSPPVPSYFSKGTYAKYDLKMTAQAKGLQMTVTGELGWEVVERTSTDIVFLVYGKATFMGFKIEYKYKLYMDPNTGNVKKVEWIQTTGGKKPLPGTDITGEGLWIPTDVKEGSKVVVGKGKTATIVGTEVVKDASGKSWVCWKAVTNEGIEMYYDKASGLLIKMYFSKTMETGKVEVTLLLKETNVSVGGGILGILGYITIGGFTIPVLVIVIAAIVIVVVIVVLVLLLRKPAQPPPPPPPPATAPPPPPPPPPS